ncbi:hypothetical protein [Mycobacterium uberis]|uniref:hypothetical protein n=1 Tax=Mycobacterium uberis TaxID=2162698 RepID=UPI001FB4B689|nr:hypothetical protein [Mycobacterium uberis]
MTSPAHGRLWLCAYHDVAHSGMCFAVDFQKALVDRFPGTIDRIDTSLPNWWSAIFAPVVPGVGALWDSREMMITSAVMNAIATALFANIARNSIVPGQR